MWAFYLKIEFHQHLKFNFSNFKSDAGKVIAHKIENEDWKTFNYEVDWEKSTQTLEYCSLSLSLF